VVPRWKEEEAKKMAKVMERSDKAHTIKNCSMFDSNLGNMLQEQRKIIYSKNYELDSRAYGIKDFGF